jgi:hypothetical protein
MLSAQQLKAIELLSDAESDLKEHIPKANMKKDNAIKIFPRSIRK